jgi:hypothetical protein
VGPSQRSAVAKGQNCPVCGQCTVLLSDWQQKILKIVTLEEVSWERFKPMSFGGNSTPFKRIKHHLKFSTKFGKT